jgi:hypothetical protein
MIRDMSNYAAAREATRGDMAQMPEIDDHGRREIRDGLTAFYIGSSLGLVVVAIIALARNWEHIMGWTGL